jgi:tRNA modification GTPase
VSGETIAAIATPPGRGAVAIVRVSGPATRAVAGRVFRGASGLRARSAVLGTVFGSDGAVIDRGLALFFPGPKSYTGEDVVEFHVHGSVAVARETLLATLAAGARLATPGEFTRRAFLAGKLDLCEAEAVADLIDAERHGAVRAAAARLSGGLATEVERLRTVLRVALEAVAASLDFPDEVEAPRAHDLARTVESVDAELAALAATFERGRLVRDGLSVAVVGPPNAGKSSLVNALLGADRVLVSAQPGTTRDTIEESLALGNGAVARLIDTAGLRTGADPLERAGIVRTEAALAQADVALVVVDGSRRLDGEAHAVLERTRDRPRLVYFNKRDLGETGYGDRGPAEADALFGSARRPGDVAEVLRRLAKLAAGDTTPAISARATLGTARQAGAVLAARASLADARATIESGDPIDLVATDLALADAALGDLSGRDAGEAMLDAVFARFCIGK